LSTFTSTIPESSQARSAPTSAYIVVEGGDQRTVFRGVDWHTYNNLSVAAGERSQVRLIYDGKDLELMVVGNVHEQLRSCLLKIINAVAMGLDIDHVDCGETTWTTEIRGLEADLSYYFDAEKIRVAREALARMSMDASDYPLPDLAVEIDMSPPQVDRAAIYRELGVAEVWRLVRGNELFIEQLQADGSYAQVAQSRFLHIRPEDVLRWLTEASAERQSSWNRRLNQWAMGLTNPA
jgi:Uma2 family endonuclease